MQRLILISFVASSACNGIDQSPECQQYLQCTEAITPGSSTQYLSSYGENGTCWSTDSRAADRCTVVCVQGRMTLAAGLGRDKAACQ